MSFSNCTKVNSFSNRLIVFFFIIIIKFSRPQATAEGLAKLKAVFKKDGVVTAGNASVSKNIDRESRAKFTKYFIDLIRIVC